VVGEPVGGDEDVVTLGHGSSPPWRAGERAGAYGSG
jgi:hypothetical protein